MTVLFELLYNAWCSPFVQIICVETRFEPMVNMHLRKDLNWLSRWCFSHWTPKGSQKYNHKTTGRAKPPALLLGLLNIKMGSGEGHSAFCIRIRPRSAP